MVGEDLPDPGGGGEHIPAPRARLPRAQAHHPSVRSGDQEITHPSDQEIRRSDQSHHPYVSSGDHPTVRSGDHPVGNVTDVTDVVCHCELSPVVCCLRVQ